MSRNMKHLAGNISPRNKVVGNTLIGLFVGLVVGVLVAAGVVMYINKTPPPFSNKGQSVPAAAPAAPGTPPVPLALPGKPGDPMPQEGADKDKPRFDFYKILPGNAEAVPDSKPSEPKATEAAKDKEPLLKDPLFLQTGSFQSAADADNQKAKLALSGMEASVQQVMLQDKTWYRVRLGPFRKMDEVNALRTDLAKQGIEASVVK